MATEKCRLIFLCYLFGGLLYLVAGLIGAVTILPPLVAGQTLPRGGFWGLLLIVVLLVLAAVSFRDAWLRRKTSKR